MNLNRNNYEAYFIDFLEGNLNPAQVDQFLDFISQNPDLKEELHSFELISLPTEKVSFQDKNKLYKKTADRSTDTIAYLEGDLSITEEKLFENEMNTYPELKREYELFIKTRLQPDLEIIYPNRKQLYRKNGRQIKLKWKRSAAAVIIIAITIGTILQTEKNEFPFPPSSEIAKIETKLPANENLTEPQNQVSDLEERQTENIAIDYTANPLTAQNTPVVIDTDPQNSTIMQRDSVQFKEIALRNAVIDQKHIETQLTIPEVINESSLEMEAPTKAMTIDELLVVQVRKIGAEGMETAQKLAESGLEAASEISGERLGFVKKNGKVEKINFESRLLAFSIPIKKRQ